MFMFNSLWRLYSYVLAWFQGAKLFEDKLLPAFLATYHDSVHSVRMAATRCLEPLSKFMGVEWCAAKLAPKFREMYDSGGNYLQRITVLYAIKVGPSLCAIISFLIFSSSVFEHFSSNVETCYRLVLYCGEGCKGLCA